MLIITNGIKHIKTYRFNLIHKVQSPIHYQACCKSAGFFVLPPYLPPFFEECNTRTGFSWDGTRTGFSRDRTRGRVFLGVEGRVFHGMGYYIHDGMHGGMSCGAVTCIEVLAGLFRVTLPRGLCPIWGVCRGRPRSSCAAWGATEPNGTPR